MELRAQGRRVLKHDRAKIYPGLPPSDITRIQETFGMVSSHGEQIVSRFYDVLFERFPELQLFFPQSHLSQQYAALLEGLRSLVLHLENPHVLRYTLVQLGKRHQRYGVEPRHYPPVVNTLLHVLTEFGGGRIDGQAYNAWKNFLHLMRAIMLENHSPEVLPDEDQDGKSFCTVAGGNTKRILLIDDDHQLLNLYQAYLEIQGYFCSQVLDVAWAFTHLQMSYYDLVITDFQMPGMNGIQLRKNLDSLGNGWCPPFVLLTGSLNQEIQRHALESGFLAVLKKPIHLSELGSSIRKVFENYLSHPGKGDM